VIRFPEDETRRRNNMRGKRIALFGIFAMIVALVGSAAYTGKGHDTDRNEIKAMADAKVSLSQAIGIAEQNVSGKAIRAEREDENGTFVYGMAFIRDRGGGNFYLPIGPKMG
jgi:hypothetical protein